ncbi:putative winged helix-turn-helix domain containing protein 3 [Homarus americanus]|uniref:Putative winged helix-turn-helix domain containing protein 3 n=1 Tax=Homarus americanus TaxID=6706 RepID=A0A8J5MW82_HOMAM|nr:putative winged helix-turn-helix domain containing protein 3 [Homarus americanus]
MSWSYSNRSVILPTTTMGHQHHAISQRRQFVGIRNAELSISEMARQIGVSRSTMQYWLQQFEESGNLTNFPRSRRPRLTSAADNTRIVAEIRGLPFTNTRWPRRSGCIWRSRLDS